MFYSDRLLHKDGTRPKGAKKMSGWESALTLLPVPLQKRLLLLPPKLSCNVQEIRLRRGQPVCLTIGGCNEYLSATCSEITPSAYNGVLCEKEWIDYVFDIACEYSVYAHQEELRQGYITARNGCRIGVAGAAVFNEGNVISYRAITSLCIRVAREHLGCARILKQHIFKNGCVESTLLCGAPSCGKTSMLRDLALQMSEENLSVTVIDERGEISKNGVLTGCDVLQNTPKAIGIEQAVRCLSPQLLIVDELGGEEETKAVLNGVYRGVPTVASVHGKSRTQLLGRSALRSALENGAFRHLAFMSGCHRPGEIERVVLTEEWLHEMDRSGTDCGNRNGDWDFAVASLTKTGAGIAGSFATDPSSG